MELSMTVFASDKISQWPAVWIVSCLLLKHCKIATTGAPTDSEVWMRREGEEPT
jgi:hypothetical protein